MKHSLRIAVLSVVTAAALLSQVTTTIADIGPSAIHTVTGTTPSAVTLLSAVTCSRGETTVSGGAVYTAVEMSQDGPTLFTSEVVAAVLEEMQASDHWARAYRGATAAASITTMALTVFKLSPQLNAILQIAPLVYSAGLGVAHGPRQLSSFSALVLGDNSDKRLAAGACFTALLVARRPPGVGVVKTFQVEVR